jgi:hypothetical protein
MHILISVIVGVVVFFVGRILVKWSPYYRHLDSKCEFQSTRVEAENRLVILSCLLFFVSILLAFLYAVLVPEGSFH